jgi:tellurite resistance protein TehA-like permease
VANRNEFVWFFPISVIAALVMLFTKPSSIEQMRKIYRYVAGCGLVSTAIVLVFFLEILWQLSQMDEEMRAFVGIHLGIDF